MGNQIPLSPDEKKALADIVSRIKKHIEELQMEWKKVSLERDKLTQEIIRERIRLNELQVLLGKTKGSDTVDIDIELAQKDLKRLNTPELVLEILKSTGEPMDTAAVMKAIHDLGISRNESTVRSALRRLEGDDLPDVKRVRWGVYQYFGPQGQEMEEEEEA